MNHSYFYDLEGNQGISIEVVFWQLVQRGYFQVEIFSVRAVDPRKRRLSRTAPSPDQLQPTLLWEKRYWTYQIMISQKKFGCLVYAKRPSVAKPFLNLAGSFSNGLLFSSLYFSVWKFHCCWSATTSPTKNRIHRRVMAQSQRLSCCWWAILMGEENHMMRTIWQYAVNAKLRNQTRIQWQFFLMQSHRQSYPPFWYPPLRAKLQVNLAPQTEVSPSMIHCLLDISMPEQCFWWKMK